MVTDRTVLQLADDVTHQSMGAEEDTVILSLASGTLYTCNQTTADFLGMVDGKRTIGELIDQLTEMYDAPRQEVYDDFLTMAQELIDEELLTPREP